MMTSQTKTCGQCRFVFIDGTGEGFCCANPPTVSEHLLKESSEVHGNESWQTVVKYATVRPVIVQDDIACRFFSEGGE